MKGKKKLTPSPPKTFLSPSQVVPHVTDAVQDWIERVASVPVDGKPGRPDVCVIELVSVERRRRRDREREREREKEIAAAADKKDNTHNTRPPLSSSSTSPFSASLRSSLHFKSSPS